MEELRQIKSDFKIDSESRTVEGYAAVFDTPSEYIGWTEIIHRDAITDDTIKNSDIFAKFNHQDDKILARSKYGVGSLLLEVDDKGLRYMFDSPNTALGNELLEYLHRGDIDSSSFAFSINAEDDTAQRWYKKDGQLYREIYKIDRLYDVSPVFQPAYSSTSCSTRAYEDVKKTSDEIDAKMDLIRKEIDEM